MIIALLLLMISGSEEALRLVVMSASSTMRAELHGIPTIILTTHQPDSEVVDAMAGAVPEEELRSAMVKESRSMSLRAIVRLPWKVATPEEVEKVVQGGTAEERLARFKQAYPFGLLRFSAPGEKPFVTWEWLTARIDKHGDFQMMTGQIHLVELTRVAYGWKIANDRSVALGAE